MNFLLLISYCQFASGPSPEAPLQVVAFLGVECPLARLYARRLNELQAEFPQVEFRAYAPNAHDSREEVAGFQQFLDFPIQRDRAAAIRLGPTRSPEVFLISAGEVVYSGRIDDQYAPGSHRPNPTRRDLAVAIQEVLAGKNVIVPRVEPAGCHLNIEPPPTRQAADALAIIHAKCATCHHPQTAAPFSLLTYDDARAWQTTLREVITNRRMPPWGAEVGTFSNDRRITDDERQRLLAWIDAGCPQGDGVSPPEFDSEWSFTPDLVLEAPSFQVPATGTIEYQEFKLPALAHDTWVSAIEMRGSRAVHHVNALLEPANADPAQRYVFDGDDYLATMVAGNPGVRLPEGTAKLIPANWRIKLEIHYEPIGSPVLDKTAIALKIVGKPNRRVVTKMLLKNDIVLPPRSMAMFQNDWRLDRDYTLMAIFPHMHLRGKSMRVTAILPNQPPEVLLDVPRYDYAWQDRYELARPRNLPAGTLIEVTACWDNTSVNPNNPDPGQTVRAGKLATDEMFQCSLDVYETQDAPGRGRHFTLLPLMTLLALTHGYFRIRRQRVR